MPNNKTFCIAPWVQVVMRSDGKLNPCCHLMSNQQNIKTTDLPTYYSSNKLVELRDNMIAGVASRECSSCYYSEEHYGTSMRTEMNLDYKFINSKYYEKTLSYFGYNTLTMPNRLEIHVSNICNLKCLTCDPSDSSAFLTEDKILKISDYNQKDYNINEAHLASIVDQINANGIEILDLRGGESMLEPKIRLLLSELDPNIANKIKIRIQTNGTIFDNEWISILNRFRSAEVMLSIDAFGTDNEYIRYPAKWETIINTYEQLSNMSIIENLFVNVTVSNLNLPVLPNLLDWLLANKVSCKFFPLSYPDYYNLLNLPTILLEEYVNNLRPYQNKFEYVHANRQLDGIIANIDSYLTTNILDDGQWLKFCNMIAIRDKHRKNSIFDISPQFREYWHAKN